jgi:hypothetical protein
MTIQHTKRDYPMGTISHATMRHEDLIPTFCDELADRARLKTAVSGVSPAERTIHRALVRQIRRDMRTRGYWDGAASSEDLSALFDALEAYAAPYFYFGAHPGDGSDYGYWLSEFWDDDFDGLRVADLSEIPSGFRGELAVVTDHGNVTLYTCNGRNLREVWSVV